MPFVARDEAILAVGPFLPRLHGVVRSAWSDWMNSGIPAQMQHKRVRANYVWNQLLVHARREFFDDPHVHVETMGGCDGILLNGRLFIRMKKGTPELLSRNYPTQAALAFNDPVQDLFGGIGRLELVYVLNDTETDVERICLVQRYLSSVAWAIDIEDATAELKQVVIPFVMPKIEGTVADRVIRPLDNMTQGGDQEEANEEE